MEQKYFPVHHNETKLTSDVNTLANMDESCTVEFHKVVWQQILGEVAAFILKSKHICKSLNVKSYK